MIETDLLMLCEDQTSSTGVNVAPVLCVNECPDSVAVQAQLSDTGVCETGTSTEHNQVNAKEGCLDDATLSIDGKGSQDQSHSEECLHSIACRKEKLRTSEELEHSPSKHAFPFSFSADQSTYTASVSADTGNQADQQQPSHGDRTQFSQEQRNCECECDTDTENAHHAQPVRKCKELHLAETISDTERLDDVTVKARNGVHTNCKMAMAQRKRVHRTRFSSLEVSTLLTEINKRRDVMLRKPKYGMIQEQLKSWLAVQKIIHSVTDKRCKRTVKDLRKKWCNLKQRAERERKTQEAMDGKTSVSWSSKQVLAVLNGTYQFEQVALQDGANVTPSGLDRCHSQQLCPGPSQREDCVTNTNNDQLILDMWNLEKGRFSNKELLHQGTTQNESQRHGRQQSSQGLQSVSGPGDKEDNLLELTPHGVSFAQMSVEGEEEVAANGRRGWTLSSSGVSVPGRVIKAEPEWTLSDCSTQDKDSSQESTVKVETVDVDRLVESHTEHRTTPTAIQEQLDVLVNACEKLKTLGVEAGAMILGGRQLMLCGSERLAHVISKPHPVATSSGSEDASSQPESVRNKGGGWRLLTLRTALSPQQQTCVKRDGAHGPPSVPRGHHTVAACGGTEDTAVRQQQQNQLSGCSSSEDRDVDADDTSEGRRPSPELMSQLCTGSIYADADSKDSLAQPPVKLTASLLEPLTPTDSIQDAVLTQSTAEPVHGESFSPSSAGDSFVLPGIKEREENDSLTEPFILELVSSSAVTLTPVTEVVVTGKNSGEGNQDNTGNDKGKKSQMQGEKMSTAYQCQDCGKFLSSRSSLKAHERIHKSEKPFPCDMCNKAFGHVSGLAAHREIHLGLHKVPCETCGRVITKSNMSAHKPTHTGEKPFKCEFCGMAFAFTSALTLHRRQHTGERPFMCDICGEAFKTGFRMREHRTEHTGEKPYVCNFCGEGFRRKDLLSLHERKHTGVEPYRCGMCGKAFANQKGLKVHKRLHTGEKPYVCDVCGAKFHRPDIMRNHKKKHNEDTA